MFCNPFCPPKNNTQQSLEVQPDHSFSTCNDSASNIERVTPLDPSQADSRLGSIVILLGIGDRPSHLGILTSIKDGNLYYTHATDGVGKQRVVESVIKRAPYRKFSMFTPKNNTYRLEILNQARNSICQNIIYDDRNLIPLEQKKFTEVGIEKRSQAEKDAHDKNIWRRVKFLGRSLINNGFTNIRGLQCTQFVTIVLQNSEMRAEQISSVDLTGINWVSDKHNVDEPTFGHGDEFDLYQERLRSVSYEKEYSFIPDSQYYQADEYGFFDDECEDGKNKHREVIGKKWTTSAQIWESTIPPHEFYKKTAIPVDSKIASPDVLYSIFQSNPEVWGEEIKTDAPHLEFSELEKVEWKKLQTKIDSIRMETGTIQSLRRNGTATNQTLPKNLSLGNLSPQFRPN